MADNIQLFMVTWAFEEPRDMPEHGLGIEVGALRLFKAAFCNLGQALLVADIEVDKLMRAVNFAAKGDKPSSLLDSVGRKIHHNIGAGGQYLLHMLLYKGFNGSG